MFIKTGFSLFLNIRKTLLLSEIPGLKYEIKLHVNSTKLKYVIPNLIFFYELPNFYFHIINFSFDNFISFLSKLT